MRRSILFALLLSTTVAAAQPSSLFRPDPYRRLVLHRHDGSAVSGWFVAQTDSSVVIHTGHAQIATPRAQLARIDLLTAPVDDLGLLGFVLGTYVAVALIYTDLPGDPTLDSDFNETIVSLPIAAVLGGTPGGGIGLLLDEREVDDRVSFQVDDAPDRADAEWRRLAKHLDDAGFQRWNLSLHGASALTPGSFLLHGDRSAVIDDLETSRRYSPFVWLRRFEAAYSPRRDLDVGIMMLNVFEVTGTGDLDDPLSSDSYRLMERLRGESYQALLRYRPIVGMTRSVDATVGVGLGLLNAEMRQGMTIIDSTGSTDFQSGQQIDQLKPIASLLCDIGVALTPQMLLGISADAAFAPSINVPADERFEIPAGPVPFYSLSVGFTFGYRF